jgi:hypothetical protein
MKKTQSRRRVKHLRVPALPDEIMEIKRNAAACGLPVAAYLRTLGLHYEPKGILDSNAVIELSKVNGDLGRLGGLLKMWLTNDDRLKALGKEEIKEKINTLLEEIQATQELLFEAAKKV